MPKENKSKYALLGILSVCPGSGYDIKKFMEQSTSNFWNESYGQIYPMLKKLVDEGLAVSRAEKQEGKPERYLYTLTDRGLEELQHWLVEPIEYATERNELLLKLLFGQQVSMSDNIEHVQRYRQLNVELLAKYRGIEAHLKDKHADQPDQAYALITVRYGIHRCLALLNWCDETLNTLQAIVATEEARD
ncbi:PadR family transcriptional regulator [Dictyobacter formicarum]|uniref:PadR family transcriptional regulator n=1 Tax=Dictyobacter formicarum TaxID=2778368 RepID=A0ABQ3VU57_9CHLR|nr:PadR family transcriptional regulator [Dictyobacter formicarum]GHO89224.1 hypothetical protein KSZ_72300 [Dictyobacter formicarum]